MSLFAWHITDMCLYHASLSHGPPTSLKNVSVWTIYYMVTLLIAVPSAHEYYKDSVCIIALRIIPNGSWYYSHSYLNSAMGLGVCHQVTSTFSLGSQQFPKPPLSLGFNLQCFLWGRDGGRGEAKCQQKTRNSCLHRIQP